MKKYIGLIVLLVTACNVMAEVSFNFCDCTFMLSEKYKKNKENNYFYSENIADGVKNISITNEKFDIVHLLSDSPDIADVKIYKGKDFYVFSYKLNAAPLGEPQELLDFTRLWNQDASVVMVGFKLEEIKSMTVDCPTNWPLISKTDFLSTYIK